MGNSDKTEIFAASPVTVRIVRGTAVRSKDRFVHNFRIGRGEECDLRFSDARVSSNHAEVYWEEGQWRLKDLKSRNGTWLNGTRIESEPLPARAKVELAPGGPVLELEVQEPKPRREIPASLLHLDPAGRAGPGGPHPDDQATPGPQREDQRVSGAEPGDRRREGIPRAIPQERPREEQREGAQDARSGRRGMEESAPKPGERTMMFNRAFERVQKKHRKRLGVIIGVVLLVLAGALGVLYHQAQRLKKLEDLHAAAENVFYTAKMMELQLARLQSRLGPASDPQLVQMLKQEQQMEAIYDGFMDELGISRGKLTEEEWLIYTVARRFGECTVTMPKGFVETVKRYIGYWRRTPLYASAMARARANGYPALIRETMLEQGMPPQFFYLAMQESGFNKDICGPATASGIAKGMWQFIPGTAYRYNLRTGPLVDERKTDPLDDRHDVRKSTAAAARYLRDLYQSEAQASGLLVMACYNWKETRIREMLKKMPENPRERNFWKLLGGNMIPQETYDYVFSIIAAAVIGENPRLFGFEFDNPLNSGHTS